MNLIVRNTLSKQRFVALSSLTHRVAELSRTDNRQVRLRRAARDKTRVLARSCRVLVDELVNLTQ